MIELLQVEKNYLTTNHTTIPALKNINLTVQQKEIFGVIGQSGAGKSTLIRCVNLLERPTQGQIKVAGQELAKLNEKELRAARRQIGMIFQHFNLLSSKTTYQNIALPLTLLGDSKKNITNVVMPLLELVGLQNKKNSYPAQLSGGQKQRVAIARALACQPKVLLCDEATSALDPQTTYSILELLKDINAQLGLTILLITHEMSVVKDICDRVAILHQGEIIEQSNISDFFTNPKTQIAKDFIKTALKQELPPALQQQLLAISKTDSNPVWRIFFKGHSAAEPVIGHLIQQIGLGINILQANLEYLHHDIVGIMVVEIIANHAQIPAGIAFLKDKGLTMEIMGYVTRNHQ